MPTLEKPSLDLLDLFGVQCLLVHMINQQLVVLILGLTLGLGAYRSASLADEDGTHGVVCEDVGSVFCSIHLNDILMDV